ncbi:Fc.00g067520.m01.CDS01 [Cosmosporella sp. VM-42]
MIMAPAVEHSASGFPRSHSDTELLSLSFDKPEPALSLNHGRAQSYKNLPSLPSLPAFDVPSFNTDFELDTSLFLGDKATTTLNLPAPTTRPEKVSDEKSKPTARSRTNSLVDRPRSWLPSFKVEEEPQRPTTSAGDRSFGGAPDLDELKPLEKSLTLSSSFANLTKRSWMSRSPSPSGKKAETPKEKSSARDQDSNTSIKLAKTRKRPGLTVDQAQKNRSTDSLKSAAPKAFTRASSYFSKMKQKPITLGKLNTNTDSDNSCASSATSLAPPTSTTEVRTPQSISTESNTTVTDESSIEMPPHTRDPLWSSFKTLEVEFKGFLSKSTAHRMAQVQAQLVPFLRSTMNHESTKRLYPEDVDKRATILNKWWTTILEMLDGQAPQPIPGVDRPVLYDVATMMMMRLEWRQTTSYFLPLNDRSPAERVRARSWTNSSGSSLSSSQAAFVAESAEHNVRTMFVNNLIKQMAFVVEKLSLRHAPMSLVNFAGKACAYAFFFAPGVADILVRLWGLTPELIRRVSDEVGLPKKNKGESEDIVALFPPSLGLFGWTSPKGMWDNLKKVPKLPMLVARIPWTGPWVSRWKGRDTDLFFIFCKYFHILCEQFMPPGLPLLEKARSPGFALVLAQLLANLDTTVHRQAAIEGGFGPALVDGMQGADAAVPLPLPPSNLMKGMSENRLIMLLKDFLSDDSVEIAGARHTFAEAFAVMMKAATCRTSQFNSGACFTLCDFLEEALMLYSEFEDPDSLAKYIDWNFWFDVCKKIIGSFNTMSEVRMMSFVFAIWDAISKDPRRKEEVCLGWLLTEETFDTFFNHWCPMVRAYYHRLLCWRICRDVGKANEVDDKIFAVVALRLKTVWSHYLHLKQTAEDQGRFPPTTAPVLPAPGKKFMIIRQELNAPQPGIFMGFDQLGKGFNVEGPQAMDDELAKSDGKKRWSLLGKVFSLGSGGNQNTNPDDQFQAARRETAESRSRPGNGPPPPPKLSMFAGSGNRSSEDDSLCSSPTYEEQKFVFKFILTWQHAAAPSRDRILTRPRLPGPAQARVNSQARSGSTPPAGLPPPTRKFSGSPQIGLIDGAKNATPVTSPIDDMPRRLSLKFDRTASWDSDLSFTDLNEGTVTPVRANGSPSPSTPADESDRYSDRYTDRFGDALIDPVKPTGFYTKNAIYTGRALAEWGQVIWECNNFVERRRDEGVMGLNDIEIPILGVEGFRKIGG